MADENPMSESERHSIDAWASLFATDKHLLAGARVHNHWVRGDLLTRDEYDQGIKAFAGLEVK